MGIPKPTIKDVAALAGVAVSTVSLVINNRARVSPETRRRVLQAVEQLQYYPNAVAQRLARNEVKCLAVIVPSIANPFFSGIVREIQSLSQRQGYDVVIYSTEDDPEVEALQLEAARRNRVAGIFLIGEHTSGGSPNDELILSLEDAGTPVVLIEREVPGGNCATVTADKFSGAYRATQHLIMLGHENLAFVGGFLNRGWSEFRRKGFEKAAADAGMEKERLLILDGDFTPLGGYQAGRELLCNQQPITGIVAANDQMAIGVLRALLEMGKKVPEDFSVVGFDNIKAARFMTPALTTVHVPTAQMGSRAAAMMMDLLSGRDIGTRHWRVDTELILRESTGRPHS